MMRSHRILLCLGILLLLGCFQDDAVHSQDFPYVVPQAPEFDGQGSQVDSLSAYPDAPRKRSKRRADSYSSNGQTDVRSIRPYVPQETQAPATSVRAPNGPVSAPAQGYGSPPPQTAPIAAVPSQPPAQAQQRPDCSRFPMMIAQARSEQEMQNAARMYLTCLLHSGWSMEQARQHVITTVEATYRAAR
jgi:hypothetical protein